MGSIVCFSTLESGHMRRLLVVLEGLMGRGRDAYVFSPSAFRPEIEASGAAFVDLFAGRSLDSFDSTSMPIPIRYVTFAATCADDLVQKVRELDPDIILYSTFALFAPIVARALGVASINLCVGHAYTPARAVAVGKGNPRQTTSDAAWAAVKTLREQYGVEGASPFSYGDNVSPFLNVYSEPSEYLLEADRAALEPIAFYGSLSPARLAASADATAIAPFAATSRRAYVAFGTGPWLYYAPEVVAAMDVISQVLSEEGYETILSLSGRELEPAVERRLARSGVRIEHYVDQLAMLRHADLFITHHGLNSTHEAVFAGVPMLSYPFWADQPALARRCEDLGLAVPLVEAPLTPLEPSAVRRALATVEQDADRMAACLAEAASWEQRVIEGREEVVERILALARER